MRNKGVTVWEVLAVLVVLLVLAAIIFPVFAKKHDRSPQIWCSSNERQIGLAILQYAQDSDGNTPNIADAPGSSRTWRVAISAYTKSNGVYQCPSRTDKQPGPDGFPRSYAANYSGDYNGGPLYKGNGTFAGPGSRPVSLNDFKDPTSLIMLCEVAGSNAPEFNIDNAARFGPDTHLLWAGHMGGSNYLLADGHVKWEWPDRTRTKWYRDPARPLSAAGLAILKEAQERAGH